MLVVHSVSLREAQNISGDIFYSRLLGQDLIIINSESVARELLERRSAIYSDRPVVGTSDMYVNLCYAFYRASLIKTLTCRFGQTFVTAIKPYGETLRRHRRLYHQLLRAEASASYRGLYLHEASKLITNLLDAPLAMEEHLKTCAD